MGWRFWVDRGGTFTDLVGISPHGQFVIRKVLSEGPDQRGDPAIKAIREVLDISEREPIPNGLIKEVRLGTTIATNTLLEGMGQPVILFCNFGLKDLLQVGDQHRTDLFALNIERPPSIAKAVVEVSGRIDAQGSEIEPLSFEKLG